MEVKAERNQIEDQSSLLLRYQQEIEALRAQLDDQVRANRDAVVGVHDPLHPEVCLAHFSAGPSGIQMLPLRPYGRQAGKVIGRGLCHPLARDMSVGSEGTTASFLHVGTNSCRDSVLTDRACQNDLDVLSSAVMACLSSVQARSSAGHAACRCATCRRGWKRSTRRCWQGRPMWQPCTDALAASHSSSSEQSALRAWWARTAWNAGTCCVPTGGLRLYQTSSR